MNRKIIVSQQANDSEGERGNGKVAQEVGFGTHRDQEQHGRLDQPSNGDPVSIELQWDGDGYEGNRDGDVQKVNGSDYIRITPGTPFKLAAQ